MAIHNNHINSILQRIPEKPGVYQYYDTVIPVWGTKRFGGSKWGVWGSTIGLIAGLFLGPWGVILGPFVGAVVFELLGGKPSREAIRAGWGSFIGLLSGTIIKLICCGLMAIQCFQSIW